MSTNRLQFRTKRDVNGNSRSLIIDLSTKEYSVDNHWISNDFITVTKKGFRSILESAKKAGYKQIP